VIAAAGSGERLGAGGPKALVELAGRPLIEWSIDAFAASSTVGLAVVAAPPGHEHEFSALGGEALEVAVVTGGRSRSESVAAALEVAEARTGLVAVHDAARPLVGPSLIDAVVGRLAATPDVAGVIAATPIADTVKRAAAAGERPEIAETLDRSRLWSAQTPQAFRAEALAAALATDAETLATATDDASLVERAGGKVLIEPAPATNLKVTTAADLRLAELLLAER
jgi:2-C-methyl-D-erythritol 4-phosphate cytidylyltransferase